MGLSVECMQVQRAYLDLCSLFGRQLADNIAILLVTCESSTFVSLSFPPNFSFIQNVYFQFFFQQQKATPAHTTVQRQSFHQLLGLWLATSSIQPFQVSIYLQIHRYVCKCLQFLSHTVDSLKINKIKPIKSRSSQ